ncbi:hypothetical protein CKO28_21625 [Rhodovibrio sodomensis]|uniref:Uncharacterized protein n=1 Tax=Rhodovibrio sodomensis TaxID=1088 RepID=A0ABS1DMM1_9PROT|nr:hypothetical protein [Rhodovibrio sodomensis]MBK1670625.1 hypothetical protein [Rhodovibrio sodomensis]
MSAAGPPLGATPAAEAVVGPDVRLADAPWHVLPADDKKYARVRALQLIFQGLSNGLEMRPPAVDPELIRAGTRIGLKVPKDAQ